MKLLIDNDRVVGMALDEYPGPMLAIPEPEGFQANYLSRYIYKPETQSVVLTPPSRVSMSAGCTALAELPVGESNAYAMVEYVIANMPSPEKEMAQIQWTRATEIFRNSPIVGILAGLLELTEAQLDALFMRAGDIDESYNTHL